MSIGLGERSPLSVGGLGTGSEYILVGGVIMVEVGAHVLSPQKRSLALDYVLD